MSESQLVETIAKDKYVLKVFYDHDDVHDPRSVDNLGKLVCWHKKYNLGDMHNFPEPCDFHNEIIDEENHILPVYLYDHSGLSIQTTPFHCTWDSGQLGYIYVSHERCEKENITKQNALSMLQAEINLYNQYLNGEVYGYQLYKKKECPTCNHSDLDEIDSCWGFYGDDYLKQIKEYLSVEYKEILFAN